MPRDPFTGEISRHIWDLKYRYRPPGGDAEPEVTATWRRVARAVASVEAGPARWAERFYEILAGFRFLPGGRIQAGAGTGRRVTLFNCFVMGVIEDSLDGIFDALKEGALTLQQGGGVGYDFSTLRPRGVRARATGAIASGPVSFMRIWDAACATLLSTGARRGAMMATLRCDHPDVLEFVEAKRDPRELRHFNLSVQVSDAFMEAVRADRDWALVFPERDLEADAGEGVAPARRWPGRPRPVACRVLRTVRARVLWERIMRATYDYAEPGVLFIDRINGANNLGYREYLSATNPCGEIPLPPYGACDLGSVNLTAFVREPFSTCAAFDFAALGRIVRTAVRLLDDVIDVSRFPLPAQEREARGSRRIGLGITGLADALILLGLHYGEADAREWATGVMRAIREHAYRASVELAREKGAFPFFERDRYLDSTFVRALPAELRDAVARDGIRNSHLLAIAPTGTVSLLANNVSSGIEPVFGFEYTRAVLEDGDVRREYRVADYAYALWRRLRGAESLPRAFVTAMELNPEAHLAMQAALQPYVDHSISKTINVPADYDFGSFQGVYESAYRKGLKGCTTFRPNPVTGAVLEAASAEGVHCCTLEREGD
ncbi:MAG TPA: adenosylcobalamin-dependent ribonucleoside-diphosphate reductase [Chromatiales bacterium]|nr:adenosylcobalamin-dependent ribonucleoside-diphosphate reductase [Chromatiales bacterium]